MNKILITGGLGYIGTKLIRLLLKENKYSITVLDNKIFDQDVLKDLINEKKINFIFGDTRNEQLMKDLIKINDIFIPLAALVGAPLCDRYPELAKQINQDSIKFLISNLSKDQRVLYPVTNSGYGVGKLNEMCDEDSPLNPISLYGRTKVEAEKYVRSKENTICYRLATVFGVSDRMRIDLLVNNFTYVAHKEKKMELFEPHFRRNYVHVEDIGRCMAYSLNNFELFKNEVYNFGLSSANLTKEALCKKIKEHIPDFNYTISTTGKDPDKRDYYVSNDKIEKKGFKATIDLDYGIKELIHFFDQDKTIMNDNKGELVNV